MRVTKSHNQSRKQEKKCAKTKFEKGRGMTNIEVGRNSVPTMWSCVLYCFHIIYLENFADSKNRTYHLKAWGGSILILLVVASPGRGYLRVRSLLIFAYYLDARCIFLFKKQEKNWMRRWKVHTIFQPHTFQSKTTATFQPKTAESNNFLQQEIQEVAMNRGKRKKCIFE